VKRITNKTESECRYKESAVKLSIQSKISAVNSEKKRRLQVNIQVKIE